MAAVYFILQRRLSKVRISMKFAEAHYQRSSSESRSDLTVVAGEGGGGVGGRRWDLVLEEELAAVWATQTSYVTASMCINPASKLGDGYITLFVFQRMTRFEMLQLLLSMDSGDHVKHPRVKQFLCSEYLVQPLYEGGIYSLDGESIEFGVVHGVMVGRVARFLS